MRYLAPISWLAAVALTCAATAALTTATGRLQGGSGLRATYTAGGEVIQEVDPRPSGDLLDRIARRTGDEPFSVVWAGYLIVPATATYRFATPAGDRAVLAIDGVRIADSSMQIGGPVVLTRGLHAVRLEYGYDGVRRYLSLLWAREDGVLRPVPPLLLLPDVVGHAEVRQRRLLVSVAHLPALAAVVLVLAPAGWSIGRWGWRAGVAPPSGKAPRWLLAACAVLFGTGAWWGLPAYGSWAADEVTPWDVLTALDHRFAGGWATIYPPLHYVLLAILALPHVIASALGLVDRMDLARLAELAIAGRLLSTAMGVGIVATVHAIGREHLGDRAALFAALVTATALPLCFYAKTSNLDVPYVFWVTLSLLFYLRVHRTARARDFYLFCLTGTAAICTKDQAYGFYVLPAAQMTLSSIRHARSPHRPAGTPTPRVLATMALVTLAAFAVFWNLPLNVDGFTEHVRLITGPASGGYRMFPSSPRGHLQLGASVAVEMARAMSWPLALVAVWAVVLAVVRRQHTILRLLLPALSYYLCFISVVMYHYDRFLLGPIVVASLAAGWWLQSWTAPGVSGRRWRLALTGAALVYAASRGLALNLLMIGDARYDAEQTLRQRAAPHEQVAAAGLATYLPRSEMRPWTPIEEDLRVLAQVRPQYVVVNAAYALRFPPGSPQEDFYRTLASGEAGYRLLAQHRTRPRFSPLALERRFRQAAEDELSNLPKVSPTIEVYVRK